MKLRHVMEPNYKILFVRACFVLFLVIGKTSLFAQETINIIKQKLPLSIGKNLAVLIDNNGLYNSSNILLQKGFENSNKPLPKTVL